MSDEAKYLVKKDGYFYRPNAQGYTNFKFDAGRYTKAEAEAHAAVEPWHMAAVHEDDVPDERDPDKFITGLRAELAQLRAENEHLRAGCNQSRLAFAGMVSVQSAIDLLDKPVPISKGARP